MSILTRKKTTQEYKEKLASLPTNTRENIQAAINGFTRFVNQKYQSTPDKICEELITIKKTEGDEEYEKKLYDFLQDWIDWSILDKLGAYTIKTRFSILRSYLYYLGVKTNPQDIKQLLYFPRKVTEEKYPIKKQEIRDLVNAQGRHLRNLVSKKEEFGLLEQKMVGYSKDFHHLITISNMGKF